MVNIKVGDKAPDFTLPDVDMKPRSLKEFLGKKGGFSVFSWRFHFNMHQRDVCVPRFDGEVD